MVKRMLTLAVVLGFAATLGCSTTQKWMAGGAVVGASTGALIGAHSAEAGEGALIGGLAGATVGGLVGNIIEEKEWNDKIALLNGEIDKLKAENAQLKTENEALKKRIAELEAQVKDLQDQLKNANVRALEISLGSDVLFKSGSAALSDAGKKALDDAAAKIKSQYAGKFVMIEGHTDSDPIKVSGWKTNWELGAARSLTVLHYLVSKGLDPATLSGATFSQYQPVAGNDTKDGKAQNRRAVIVIYKNWNKPQTTK